MKTIGSLSILVFAVFSFAGCAMHPTYNLSSYPYKENTSTKADNSVTASIPVPHIETANKVAKIEVREKVSGYGCSSDLSESHTKILPFIGGAGLSLDSSEGRAKAVALFNALFAKKVEGSSFDGIAEDALNNDLLIAPTYQIRKTKKGAFFEDVCARVIGYRGVVVGFEDSKRIRSSDPSFKGSPQLNLEQIEEGKARILVF